MKQALQRLAQRALSMRVIHAVFSALFHRMSMPHPNADSALAEAQAVIQASPGTVSPDLHMRTRIIPVPFRILRGVGLKDDRTYQAFEPREIVTNSGRKEHVPVIVQEEVVQDREVQERCLSSLT